MKLQFYGGQNTTLTNVTRIEPFYADKDGLHFVDPDIPAIYQTQLNTHFDRVGLKFGKAFLLTDVDGNLIIAVKDNPKSRFTGSFISQALDIATKYEKNVVMPIFRTGNVSKRLESKITERIIKAVEDFNQQHPTLTQTINIVLQPGTNYSAYDVLTKHNIPTLGVANTKHQFIRLLV